MNVHEEIALGALVGSVASMTMAFLYAPVFVAPAAASGCIVGALIGLLLWDGVAERPDPGVRPPAPRDRRDDSDR